LSNVRVEKHWVFNRVFRLSHGGQRSTYTSWGPNLFMAKDHTRYCGLLRRQHAEKQ